MKKWLWLTAHSDSHKEMYERHFFPSFDQYLAPHCQLQKRLLPYYAGNFGEEAFNEMGRESIAYTANVLRQNIGRHIVVSGCDLRFYRDFMPEIEAALEAAELVGLNDVYGPVCGELLAFVCSERIIALYDWIAAHDRQYSNEQFTLNAGIKALGIHAAMMPTNFWTVGHQGAQIWSPGNPVVPPQDIALHHANFTIGAENKLALLDAVFAAVSDNNPSA